MPARRKPNGRHVRDHRTEPRRIAERDGRDGRNEAGLSRLSGLFGLSGSFSPMNGVTKQIRQTR